MSPFPENFLLANLNLWLLLSPLLLYDLLN